MMAQAARIGLGLLEQLGDEPTAFDVVELGETVGQRVDGGVFQLPRVGRGGLTTPRAVLGVVGDGLATVPAVEPFLREGVVVLDDAGRGEDLLVHLLGCDVDVSLPHVRIERPLHAMLDFLPVPPFAPHARDRAVSEVVGVRRLVDTGVVGDLREDGVDPLGREAAVVLVHVTERFELVEEGGLGLVWSGVRVSKIHSKRRATVDDGVGLDFGPLQPDGVAVRCVGSTVAVEVDVFHPQRASEGQAGASVGEELDDCLVSWALARIDQGRDLVLGEHVLFADALVLLAGLVGVEARDPVVATVVCERRKGGLVVVHGRFRWRAPTPGVGVVTQLEEQFPRLVECELDQRCVAALGQDAESVSILRERGDGEVAVPVAKPLPNGRSVAVDESVAVVEPVEGVPIPPTEPTEVVSWHTTDKRLGFNQRTVCKTHASKSNPETQAPPADAEKSETPHHQITDRSTHQRGDEPHPAIGKSPSVAAETVGCSAV